MNHPEGVAVDPVARRIYWANYDGDKISFARLDGTGGGDLNTVGATVNGPQGVAIDPTAGRIHWANLEGHKISFADLDGSGGGDLATPGATVYFPDFPVLLKAPSPATPPTIAGGTTLGSSLTCGAGTWAGDLLPAFLYRAPRSLGLQWSLNSADLPGMTSPSITAGSTGDYRCRVTATNQAGSATQTSAPHTVSAPTPPPSGGTAPIGGTPISQAPTPTLLSRIDSTVQSRWAYDRKTGKRFTLLLLKVISPPKRAVAQIRCSGRRCLFQSRRVTRIRNRAITLYKLLPYARAVRERTRRFRAGQLAELRITAPGFIGKVVRYKLRQRRLPVGRVLCLTPGAERPVKCAGW